MAPFISVVIDTYNHERFIEEAIASALQQDLPASEFEIVIVDDGSTDRTPEIVRKFEPRVRLLQKANGGQASTINFGTAHAQGTYIAFLDGDDVWLPNKLSRVAQEIEANAGAVLIYHKYCFWDDKENRTWDPEYFNEVSGDVLSDPRKLVRYIAAPTSSLVFRRDALLRVMPVPEECSFMWDAYAVSTVIFLGPVVAIGEQLTKNRVHGQNLWFAEKGEPDPEVLRRRVKTRGAAIRSIQNWIRFNAPPSSQAQARVLLDVWRTIQENDEFQLEPPGRIEFLRYQLRKNGLYKDVRGPKIRAINFFNAFASVVTGYKHFGLLDASWRGLDKAKDRLLSSSAGKPAGQASEPIK